MYFFNKNVDNRRLTAEETLYSIGVDWYIQRLLNYTTRITDTVQVMVLRSANSSWLKISTLKSMEYVSVETPLSPILEQQMLKI